MNKQLLRKILWGPSAIASVSITIYLSNLWYHNSQTILVNRPIQEDEEKEPKDENTHGSPDNAKEDGKDDTNEQKTNQNTTNTQPAKNIPPEETPPPPKPPSSGVVSDDPNSGTNSSTSADQSQYSQAQIENIDLMEYIRVKIKDLNSEGEMWHREYETHLLSYWKLNTTLDSLTKAISELEKRKDNSVEVK